MTGEEAEVEKHPIGRDWRPKERRDVLVKDNTTVFLHTTKEIVDGKKAVLEIEVLKIVRIRCQRSRDTAQEHQEADIRDHAELSSSIVCSMSGNNHIQQWTQ